MDAFQDGMHTGLVWDEARTSWVGWWLLAGFEATVSVSGREAQGQLAMPIWNSAGKSGADTHVGPWLGGACSLG